MQLRGTSVRLVVIGDGPFAAGLRQGAEELGLERQLVFGRPRTDVGSIYAGLDAVVHPSRSEGLPLTVIEAMHAGVPVVARPVGGIPEILRDGETGLAAVTPEEFASKLLALAADAGLRARLSGAAHEFARRWLTADVMAGEYLSCFEHVLASLTRHGPRLFV